MTIKLILDNNIPDAFEALPVAEQSVVTEALRSDRFAIYGTIELIEEMFGLAVTTRQHLLRPRVRWLLQVMQEQVINHAYPIVLSELRGAPQLYLDGDSHRLNMEILEEIANADGPLPASLGELAERSRNSKMDDNRFFIEQQQVFRDLARGRRPPTPLPYSAFLAEWWLPRIRSHLEGLFASVQDPNSATRADEALTHPERYPHVDLYLSITGARLYRNMILNRRVDPGDPHDATQLLYLHDVDWFVTNERRVAGLIRETAALVFSAQPEKRILTFSELMAEL